MIKQTPEISDRRTLESIADQPTLNDRKLAEVSGKLCLPAWCVDPVLQFWAELLQLFVGQQSFVNDIKQPQQGG